MKICYNTHMKISILTLFPEMFEGPFSQSIIKIAQEKKLVAIDFINIRDFGIGKHKVVDDTPYGGGVGMVLRVDVVHQALMNSIDKSIPDANRKIVLTSAQGSLFNQKKANNYAKLKELILICGHYEGIDARIREFIDEEVSIGDFITTGGEIPAMLITDAVSRKITGVLKDEATALESFHSNPLDTTSGVLEHPHYTKPDVYMGQEVPKILLSGHHAEIKKWRDLQSQKETHEKRPDLLTD